MMWYKWYKALVKKYIYMNYQLTSCAKQQWYFGHCIHSIYHALLLTMNKQQTHTVLNCATFCLFHNFSQRFHKYMISLCNGVLENIFPCFEYHLIYKVVLKERQRCASCLGNSVVKCVSTRSRQSAEIWWNSYDLSSIEIAWVDIRDV